MTRSVIVGAARTPFGRIMGALAPVSAVGLGTVAARGALERSGLSAEEIDYAVFGTVVQAGQMHIPSRQVTLAIGMPDDRGSDTVNKVCASGMRAIALADMMVRAGDYRVLLAGGFESMSSAPHLLMGSRSGFRFGDAELKDANLHDALLDPWRKRLMYDQAAEVAAELGTTRLAQDEWSVRSQERAVAAIDSGLFAEEIVPVTIPGRKGDTVVDTDEGPRRGVTLEALQALRPLTEGGSVTAGNAPGVNDGAGAVVLMSEGAAAERGATPLAVIRATAQTADLSRRLARVPALAIQLALEKAGLTAADVQRFEINEAFAAVAVHATSMLGVDPAIVNANGGAVALGHPVGASGARLVITLINELRRSGGGIGVAGICSGGGQGDAIVVEVPAG